jgi:tetratricopeptide (TPR) repeat protein
MSSKVTKEQQDSGFEGIELALTKTERFIEANQNTLLYIIGAIVAVIVIFIGIKRFYIAPREENASKEMFMAEKFFDKDSFDLALNGYGTYPGFLQIIEDYGLTKSAALAKYYSGVCYLHLGDYATAIEYLEKFNTKDILIGASKYSSLGDAYSAESNYEKAVASYLKGAEKYENGFSSPILLKKAGLVYEEMKDYNKALEVYTRLKATYPESQEGREMDRYIARVEQKGSL